MSLRSQLALSHLKVLLAFVIIHLALFFAATRMSDRTNPALDKFNDFRIQVNSTNQRQELALILATYAEENHLLLEVESTDGAKDFFGDQALLSPRPTPWYMVWRGENSPMAVIRVHGFERPRPPANPVIHVFATTLLAGIFALFLAFALSKAISRPLADLIVATERLEAGESDRALLADLKGPREIQELAASFTRMSETLSTNLKQLEDERDKAEASEASRRQLISDVSHNLRTPLAAAVGWVDSLIDGHVEDREACLRQVRRETLWAAQRLERLLHLSRWEHSEPMVTLQSITLSDVVLEVAENLEERANEVGLALELEIEPGLSVHADRHHLRDLIQILLENIIEHSGSDRQALVKAECQKGAVEIVVSDNGPGFEAVYLDQWTGDPVVAKTGRVSLGLAIARRLARAHGSELQLSRGADGIGSRVSFTLVSVRPQSGQSSI